MLNTTVLDPINVPLVTLSVMAALDPIAPPVQLVLLVSMQLMEPIPACQPALTMLQTITWMAQYASSVTHSVPLARVLATLFVQPVPPVSILFKPPQPVFLCVPYTLLITSWMALLVSPAIPSVRLALANSSIIANLVLLDSLTSQTVLSAIPNIVAILVLQESTTTDPAASVRTIFTLSLF